MMLYCVRDDLDWVFDQTVLVMLYSASTTSTRGLMSCSEGWVVWCEQWTDSRARMTDVLS